MKRLALALLFTLSLGAAGADTTDEVLQTYRQFAEAQNARDAARIGAFFIDGPDLLWVSDGKSFWGRDAILARMGSFQKAEIWRVEPDLDAARIVEVAPETVMLHMPLTLVIGSAASPDRLDFVVSLLFVPRDTGWKIAALLTTLAKP